MKQSLIISVLLASTFCQAQNQISAIDALKLASQNRPTLEAFRLRVEQARASARALGALPPLTLAAGASTRSNVGATDQDLALTQGVDLFGRSRALANLGAADVKIAEAKFRGEASALQSEVLTAFAMAVSAKRQSEVSAELLGIADGLLKATQRRFDEGKVAELQVIRASIEYQRAKQTSDLRDADFRASMTRLAGLLGVPLEELSVESDAVIEPVQSPTIQERSDIMLLEAEVERATAEARVARSQSRPEFSVQVVRSPWSNDPGYFVGRAQISWNLWDYGRVRNEVKAANLRHESAIKALQDATAIATRELEAVQIELESRRTRITVYSKILESAKELVVKSQRAYAEGFGTQIDVLESTRALREVEQELVEARLQLALTVIKQYEVSGYLVEVLK